MITCPKCQTVATPGASDCTGCGHLFSASESSPGSSPQRIFKWWLIFYAFWRILALVGNVIAFQRADHAMVGYYLVALSAFVLLSLLGIGLLWRGTKVGLYVFSAGELLVAFLEVLVGNYVAFIYPFIAIGIMWLVGKRAEFRLA